MIPASSAVSPTAKVRLPHQSIRALARSPVSCSDRYAQTVPMMPIGTFTQKTERQFHSASTPPRTRPMKEPAIPATMLMPRAVPRCRLGNTSVMIAAELAISMDPPTACNTRHPISHSAPAPPSNGSSEASTEVTVNRAKPAL